MSATEPTPVALKPRSEAQRQASIENGRRSRGPKSSIGKNISKLNGLKHGLAAVVALPADLTAEAAAMAADFAEAIRPRDAFERQCVREAGLAAAKLERLARSELARASDAADLAVRSRDAARAAEVADQLKRFRAAPAEVMAALRQTPEGCATAADLWVDLGEALRTRGMFEVHQAELARRLLGCVDSPPRPDHPEAYEFFRLLFQAGYRRGDPVAFDPRTLPEDHPGAVAYAELLDWIDAEAEALSALMEELWHAHDAKSRRNAVDAALLDDSPAGKLLSRYAAEASRLKRRAIEDLYRHREKCESAAEVGSGPLPGPERSAPAAPISVQTEPGMIAASSDLGISCNATPPDDPPAEAPARSEPEPDGSPRVIEPVAIAASGPTETPIAPVEPPAPIAGPPPTAG